MVQRQLGLLLGAARDEQQFVGRPRQKVTDQIGAPAPPPVGSRLREAVIGIMGGVAAPSELPDQHRLASSGHAGQQHAHHSRLRAKRSSSSARGATAFEADRQGCPVLIVKGESPVVER